nr:olfactory receptor 8K3-like [Loxodonta africana]
MDKHNLTVLNEFILTGITDRPELQAPLFGLFLIIYVISVVAMGPKMLANFVVDENTISYYFCATQLAFIILFINGELFILSAMSYDRYVAICNPLLYSVTMSQRVCWVLVAILYLYCAFVSLLITIMIFNFSFCGCNVISHFYCDPNPLLSLLCSNTHEIQLILLIAASIDVITSLLIVLVSYRLVLVAIVRMNSAVGRHKALSTCGSQLTAVIVFYETLIFTYMQPKSSHSFDGDKVASIFYTLVIPMLNPLIYSLRSKDVKYALHRTSILRMNSAEGRHKAFSTCGSHLTMAVVFYGTLIFTYVHPESNHSYETDKVASIVYTLVIPVLNPLIYSLRNKDVKHAIRRTWNKLSNIFATT